MRTYTRNSNKNWLLAVPVFISLTWLGLHWTEPHSENAVTEESPIIPLKIAARENATPSFKPILESRASVESFQKTDAPLDPSEIDRIAQCVTDLSTLQLSQASHHCQNTKVSERVQDAGMMCSSQREPEDLGPGSACDLSKKTLSAFLRMLPAFEDPRLIGQPGYPADQYFSGVTEYLQLISPESHAATFEGGLTALNSQTQEPRIAARNGLAWIALWNQMNPELISERKPALQAQLSDWIAALRTEDLDEFATLRLALTQTLESKSMAAAEEVLADLAHQNPTVNPDSRVQAYAQALNDLGRTDEARQVTQRIGREFQPTNSSFTFL